MLVEFAVANFRSFSDEQKFSFVASRDRRHPTHTVQLASGDRLLKSAALFGANASGKSNLVLALRLMQTLVATSATKLTAGDRIPFVVPFRLDPQLRDLPSRFEAKILLGEEQCFTYGFEATAEAFVREWLLDGDGQTWFHRTRLTGGKYETEFWGPLSDLGEEVSKVTRDNALLLSVGAQFNIKPLMVIFHWFSRQFKVFDMSDSPRLLIQPAADRLQFDEAFRGKIADLISYADVGIEGISVIEPSEDEFPASMRKEFKDFPGQFTRTLMRQHLAYRATHRCASSDESVDFDLFGEESKGTQRMFALSVLMMQAIETQSVVVFDEFDCSLHPSLGRALLHYFVSATSGSNSAQILIVTHDVSLFDPDVFRRDALWLIEKEHGSGRSRLYSLHDFEDAPRSDAKFRTNYLQGRYGAIPRLGPLLDIKD